MGSRYHLLLPGTSVHGRATDVLCSLTGIEHRPPGFNHGRWCKLHVGGFCDHVRRPWPRCGDWLGDEDNQAPRVDAKIGCGRPATHLCNVHDFYQCPACACPDFCERIVDWLELGA